MANFLLNDYKSKQFLNKFNEMWEAKCSTYDNLPNKLPHVDRIIVIGDIHGDIEILLECLIKAELIEIDGDIKSIDYSSENWDIIITWTGKKTVVVQVGDQIDSCRYDQTHSCADPANIPKIYNPDMPNDINILKFMTSLHFKAKEKGGAIYSLIGNHELMNVTGDMSYVSHSNIISHSNLSKDKIDDGMKKRIEMFKPGNEMANFLACTRKIALIIGDNLFVHAGIVPYITNKYSIDDINRILTLFLLGEFKDTDIINEIFMSSKYSPLWTRIFGSKGVDNKCDELMNPLMDIYKVGKIYVGHTPQLQTGIISKCNDRIWLTDAGMPSAFNKFDKISNETNGKKRDKHRSAQVLEITYSKLKVTDKNKQYTIKVIQ
jgi:hypothetical protein